MLSPPFLSARETESFTSCLCCCLQLRQCNIRKLIMPAPETHSQCSFAVHIFLHTSQEAQEKLKKDWQTKSYNLAAGKNAEQSDTAKLLPSTSYYLFSCCEPQPSFPGNGQVPSKLTQLSQGKAVMISHAEAPRLLFLCAVFCPKTPWSRPACSIAVICRTACRKTTGSSAWLVPGGLTRVPAIELIPSPGTSPDELRRNRGRLKMSAQYSCMFRFKAALWTSAKLFTCWK